MQGNAVFRTRFEDWLLAYLEQHEHIEKDEAIASGAYITSGNVQTIERYLKPLLSQAGPLQETIGLWGTRYIEYKPSHRPHRPTPPADATITDAHAPQDLPLPMSRPLSANGSHQIPSSRRGFRGPRQSTQNPDGPSRAPNA